MRKPPIHLEIQKHRSNPVGVLRSTFRDPVDGKIKHQQHGRITNVPLATLLNVQAALRNEVLPKDHPDAFRILQSKEYGACAALLALAKDIRLDTMLYSKPAEPWVQDVLAMVLGRIIYQGSKLALAHQWQYSALWELCGNAGPVDVDEHCYEAMDRLLERQPAVQKSLAKRHLKNGCLVLYDITSTYFEGEYDESELVKFGYNRDKKHGHEQVVIGLLTSSEGCPVAVEVFPGNTKDASTVCSKIKELRQEYGVSSIVFVGDRGMLTASIEKKLPAIPEADGLKIISALTHREMENLLQRTSNEAELFDDKNIIEIADSETPGYRYCLCCNPMSAQRETTTRNELLERTRKGLTVISERKTAGKADKLGAQVGKLLAKTKMGKFVKWSVEAGRLQWRIDDAAVEKAQRLDGCYVIKTTVDAAGMSKDEVVARYKSLSQVEQAFRNFKSASLELRPVHHKTDDRIRSHVFLCMLAYYLQWHMMQRLKPLFAEQEQGIKNGELERKDRCWTLCSVLECLKAVRRNDVSAGGVKFQQVNELTADQQNLLELLRVKFPRAK